MKPEMGMEIEYTIQNLKIVEHRNSRKQKRCCGTKESTCTKRRQR